MTECIFCQLISGDLPSYVIYEDSKYLAFLAIHQIKEGHTLVVPKKHYRWVWDVQDVGEYFSVVQKIANHFRKVTRDSIIYSLVMGTNSTHANVHIIPATTTFERNIRASLRTGPAKRISTADAMRTLESSKCGRKK